MQFEFDPNKDTGNQSKHGVSLALAVELDWEYVFTYPVSAIAKPAPASSSTGGADHGFKVSRPVKYKSRLAR